MTDPFATDPWATNSEPTYTPEPTSTPEKKEPAINVTPSEGKIVTTIKYGSGFDAPWTVIHSDSVEEAKRTLSEIKELLELTAAVAKYAKSLDSGITPSHGGGNSQSQQQTPPPGMETKTCAHGQMVYRAGSGARGPWRAYFCPAPKGDPSACKPIWVR